MFRHKRLTLNNWPWKRNQLLVGRKLLVAKYRTIMEFIWPIKPVLSKSTFQFWAPSYFLKDTKFAVLFTEMVFIITEMYKKLWELFSINRHLLFWSSFKRHWYLGLESSYSSASDLRWINFQIPNMNKICALSRHTSINIYRRAYQIYFSYWGGGLFTRRTSPSKSRIFFSSLHCFLVLHTREGEKEKKLSKVYV
jgi:hypothetical protein